MIARSMTQQLTLGIQLRDDASFANYFSSNTNQSAVHYLKNFLSQKNDYVAYVWAAAGQGRSHLLQACCHLANEKNLTAVYLPLKQFAELSVEMLQDLETCQLVCLDDVDAIAGQREWEEGVFHLYNRLQATQHHLLVSATCAPHELKCSLPDLKSRLSAAAIFHLQSLNDADKIAALQLHAKTRGLILPDKVGQFLLRHLPRDNHALFQTLNKLDNASLAAQRQLTIPFVKEVLSG